MDNPPRGRTDHIAYWVLPVPHRHGQVRLKLGNCFPVSIDVTIETIDDTIESIDDTIASVDDTIKSIDDIVASTDDTIWSIDDTVQVQMEKWRV